MAVTGRTLQILPGGQSAAPFSYVLPASTSFALLGVRATFDGSAAAGNFLPCVQIVSDAGVLMAQVVGSTVTAGASADVTFAPFLRAATTAATGGGIQFDTYPQAGKWLYTETNDFDFSSPNTYGTELHDFSAVGLGIGIISDVNTVSVQGESIELLQFDPPGVALGSLNSTIDLANTGVQITAGLDTTTADIGNRAARNISLDFNESGAGVGKVIISQGGFHIFEFWADGTIHGLAAVGAITWDL